MERNAPTRSFTLLFLLIFFEASAALALPNLTYPQKLNEFQQRNGVTSTTQIFGDTKDEKLVYVPWDAAAIVTDQQAKPMFNFAYNERGGTIQLVVKTGYSPATKQTIKDLSDRGYEVRPMPVIAGSWSLVGFDPQEGAQTLSSGSIANRYYETIFPTSPVGIALKLGAEHMKLMVALLESGATLAINYSYSFRGAVPAADFEVTIDGDRVHELIDRKLEHLSNKCVNDPSKNDGSVVCSSKASRLVKGYDRSGKEIMEHEDWLFAVVDINTLTKAALDDSAIQIIGRDFDSIQMYNAKKMVETLVAKTFFEPMKSEGFAENLLMDAKYCQSEEARKHELDCQGYSQWFQLRKQFEPQEFGLQKTRLQTFGTQILQAQVGFALSGVCKDLASSVVYVPSNGSPIQYGCPTAWPVPNSEGTEERVDSVLGAVRTDPRGEVWKNLVGTSAINPASNGNVKAGEFGWGSLKADPQAPRSTVLPNP